MDEIEIKARYTTLSMAGRDLTETEIAALIDDLAWARHAPQVMLKALHLLMASQNPTAVKFHELVARQIIAK